MYLINHARLLKHFPLTGDCNNALGMQKGISDESISASSTLSVNHVPSFARLYERQGAWCSAQNDKSPYIQILLGEEKKITRILTQGSLNDLRWATKYQIKYLKEGEWLTYQKADGSPVRKKMFKAVFPEIILSRF